MCLSGALWRKSRRVSPSGAAGRKSRRVSPSGRCVARAGGYRPRGGASQEPAGIALGATLRRPAKELPRIAAVYLLPYGPGRRPTGGFRLDILSRENDRPSMAGPLRAFSGGTPRLRYRPRGRYPPALSETEVAWGRANSQRSNTRQVLGRSRLCRRTLNAAMANEALCRVVSAVNRSPHHHAALLARPMP